MLISEDLKMAQDGNIEAFHRLFLPFTKALRAYLYRLTANRTDTEDLFQETFIKAFQNVKKFRGEGSLKNWVFRIATHLAFDWLKDKKRWHPDLQDDLKTYVEAHPEFRASMIQVNQDSPQGKYELKEHIDFCFTCISKSLPLRQQVVLLLKEVAGFKLKEIGTIIDEQLPNIKWLLREARKSMSEIFDHRCALIKKEGPCYQCTALNGLFNPKQKRRETRLEKQAAKGADAQKLLEIRSKIVKAIDPLNAQGFDLHELIFQKANDIMLS